MQDSTTYSVYYNRLRVGIYTSKKYAINRIKKMLDAGAELSKIELIKSTRIVTLEELDEKSLNDYYHERYYQNRDEFLNDDGLTDEEKIEICENLEK